MSTRAVHLMWSAILILGAWSLADAASPLEEIINAVIRARADGTHLTVQEVQTAILEACAERQWEPRVDGPGKIAARIIVRGRHYAEVAIPFNERAYSIRYVTSSALDYEERRRRNGEVDRKIHPNYNRWVQLLNLAIAAKLAGLSAPPPTN